MIKQEQNHLKSQAWFLSAKNDLKEIQDINNDSHIEFQQQYDDDIKQIEKEVKKKNPVGFIKFIQSNYKPD